MRPDLIRISDGGRADPSRFGQKGARLLEAVGLGLPVPDGLLVSADFVEDLLRAAGRTASSTAPALAAAFSSSPEARSLLDRLVGALAGWAGGSPGTRFAVRSSAIGEDGAAASHAGQYATVLDVTLSELGPALARSIASLGTAAASAYRERTLGPSGGERMALVLQRQVDADHAGVLFTRDPVDGTDALLVESVAGLGERLVSGHALPARWAIDRQSLAIRRFVAGADPADGQVPEVLLRELGEAGRTLESHFGKPVDVEWAIAGGALAILQVRPVTALRGPSTLVERCRGLHSRAIVEDLWSDRMSEITSSTVFEEFRDLYTYRGQLRRLGLHDIAAVPAIRVLDGYGYLSLEALAMLVGVLPPCARSREVVEAFPAELRPAVSEEPCRWGRLAGALVRLPLALTDPAALPFLTERLLRRHLVEVERRLETVPLEDYPGGSPAFLRRELERLLGLLKSLQVRNQWGYGRAATLLWTFMHLGRSSGEDESSLLERLRGVPDNVTTAIRDDLDAIARSCDEEVLAAIEACAARPAGWSELQARWPDHPAVGAIGEFLGRYRARSSNRDFVHPRWDETPGQILQFVALAARARHHREPVPVRRRPPARTRGPMLRWLVRRLETPTRRSLALREDLRFGLDKVFHRLRRLLLAVGGSDPFRPLASVEEGVFFLSLDELRAALDAGGPTPELCSRARTRAERFASARAVSPPLVVRLLGDRVVPVQEEGRMAGIPASGGLAVGPACIVRGREDFGKLRPGDILVAHNTDPAWTPLFAVAAGVVVEMGGVLNHCAIVAREFGLPTIVGLPGVTERLRDGDILVLDGDLGSLTVQRQDPEG